MQDLLNFIAKQFLCNVPLNYFAFGGLNIQEFTLENQEILINKTVNSKLVLECPIKIDYQKAFIKYFVDKLEKNSCEVHDEFYTAYGRLVASGGSKLEYFKHYLVGSSTGTIVSLKENINLISEGTTGLRTWQASLALAEWALKNQQSLFQKNILELGSGIGLTGLVISLECHPTNVYFSDCHPSVLKILCENIEFNSAQNSNDLKSDSELDSVVIFSRKQKNGVNLSVLDLPWEDVNGNICKTIGEVDLILASDVVYDSDLFDNLIQALKCISNNCKVQDIVFACTERNPETLQQFLYRASEHFLMEEEACPNQENFIWCTDPPVRIFKFRRH